ncbi:cache domain-containing sensor histidine kinase [Paenibacillus guangzhouensis]|uniref:cache domain-containing sensor histidine kinase n=1 Tax=Paenibacillus guangzhouensis TaxID=1473112 RepID=UPI0012673BF2|nr:histidine kinase [Paenibacillus guangzhouensis]
MRMRHSLRFKLIIGFVTLAIPLMVLLLYNNFYASNTVREQVAESNKNMIILYSNQIQTALNREVNLLYNLAIEDPNIIALPRSIHDPDEYYLNKGRILNLLNRDHRFNSGVDFQFIYTVRNRDFFNTLMKTTSYEEMEALQSTLTRLLHEAEPNSSYFREWKVIPVLDEYALVRFVDTGSGVYLGACVRLRNLMIPLDFIGLGQEGFSAFVTEQGDIMTNKEGIQQAKLDASFMAGVNDTYQRFQLQQEDYIVVSNPIKDTELMLSAFIPEEKLLQKLTKFRSFIFIIPILAGILLIFYLIYLNDIMLKPMNNLIRGMRKIKQGEWSFRLHNPKTREFTIINEAYNEMASEIQTLKINVYEEQIKAHKAELKHLQLQINPHFLLNSINIVYNLVEIKNYKLIQVMCVNLVKYFRFATKTNQIVVTIAEEMEHMESYIRIQQLRFPERVTYSYRIAEGLERACIPPLLIQPFIENSIKYGFDFMDRPFHMEIRIAPISEPDFYEVVIVDNGSGFPEDVLEALQNGSYFTQPQDEHLGIWNVHHRLKHIFGQDAVLAFSNEPGAGAKVRLVLPYRTLEQFSTYDGRPWEG